MQKVIAKINLKAVRENAEAFKALTKTGLCAVVKADAYGHGAEAVANALSGVADMFAVALIDEGTAIRTAACGKDILVLTPPVDETQALSLARNGFIACVPDLRTARLLADVCVKYKKSVRAHLKVNTGMNRYGMNASVLGKVCKFLKSSPVAVEGMYSHLYAHSLEESEKQRTLFLKMKAVCERYYPGIFCHLSSTYGALLGDKFAFDMVRVGLGLYGYLPEGTDKELSEKIRLKKAMKVYARAVGSRKYSFGGAGYGILPEEKRQMLSGLTVWRAGYADGFFWKKENGMRGADRNVNNLCMDVCIRQGRNERGRYALIMSDAAETAEKAGTVCYEILCSVTRRAEFAYVYK